MDVSRIALNKLAGQVTQPGLPNFMAPDPMPQLQMATVTGKDRGRNEVSVILNDVGSPAVTRVPVFGGTTDGLQEDDVVQLISIGNTLGVLARQYRPSGIVVF